MKKLISTLIAVASLASFSAVNAFAEADDIADGENYMVYDMNQDGKLNNLDIRALRVYLGHDDIYETTYDSDYRLIESKKSKAVNSDEVNEYISKNGDMVQDGKIDDKDAESLMNLFMTLGFVKSDFNGDGKVTISDAKYHLNSYAEQQSHQGADSEKPDADMMKNFIENGDYDGDGKADATDTTYLLNYAFANLKNGDVNADGAVNPVDASMVLKYFADVQTGAAAAIDFDNMAINAKGDFNNDGSINAVDASLILTQYTTEQLRK